MEALFGLVLFCFMYDGIGCELLMWKGSNVIGKLRVNMGQIRVKD